MINMVNNAKQNCSLHYFISIQININKAYSSIFNQVSFELSDARFNKGFLLRV